MSGVNRYTPEEDERILRDYWDPPRRPEVVASMADRHTERSVQFRYFQLLKLLNLGGSPQYRKLMERVEASGKPLPVPIEELVAKVHSGEAREEQRRRKQKKKEEAKALKKAEEVEKKPEDKGVFAPETPESTPVEAGLYYPDDLDEKLDSIASTLVSVESRLTNLESEPKDSSLSDFFELVAKASRYRDQLGDFDALARENDRLKEELVALQAKYDEKLKEFDEVHKRLNDIFGYYLRLTSMKKALSLGDFIEQIGTVLDKFGNVVDVSTREMGVRGYYTRQREQEKAAT